MSDKEQLILIKDLIRKYFYYLDIIETTDEGREFHPNRLGSCRIMDGVAMEKILFELKKIANE